MRNLYDKHGRTPQIINFDNSATSFPKPPNVKNAVWSAVDKYGGNPGRSGHKLSMSVAEKIFEVRNSAANMFGAETENVAFTQNCTYALNMAIKGIMTSGGYNGHIIISNYEHNSVARPVYALSKMGISYSVAKIYDDTDKTIEELKRLITPKTKCICTTIASNVTGRILPYKEIAQVAKSHNIPYIADGAQACGVLDLKLSDGFNFLCTSGHKSLYGPTGTGLLITDGVYPLATIIEGGTGATSKELVQTPYLPERLESGTINTVGILGLGKGLDFVQSKSIDVIRHHEENLCRIFTEGLKKVPSAVIYEEDANKLPILSFNIGDKSSEEVASFLSDKGFALRGGFHCAALTHETLGTSAQGTVRFSPSAFNTPIQVKALLRAIAAIDS